MRNYGMSMERFGCDTEKVGQVVECHNRSAGLCRGALAACQRCPVAQSVWLPPFYSHAWDCVKPDPQLHSAFFVISSLEVVLRSTFCIRDISKPSVT